MKSLFLCGLTFAAAAFGLSYDLAVGTRIPLSLINSVSTKQAVEGDRVYMETAFPVLENGRVVVPVGSYVAGTVTKVKRPGRMKGKAELFIRFDSLTLPNGITRDFRARIGGLDGQASEKLDRAEGTIRGDSNKGGDARTVGEATGVGTSVFDPRPASEPAREIPPSRAASPTLVFDGARLLLMVGGDQGARRAVMSLFQSDAPSLVQLIQGAISKGDNPAVRAGAHKIKGMLLNVCAPQAAGVAAELESLARTGQGERFASLASRLESEVNRVCDSMAAAAMAAA